MLDSQTGDTQYVDGLFPAERPSWQSRRSPNAESDSIALRDGGNGTGEGQFHVELVEWLTLHLDSPLQVVHTSIAVQTEVQDIQGWIGSSEGSEIEKMGYCRSCGSNLLGTKQGALFSFHSVCAPFTHVQAAS